MYLLFTNFTYYLQVSSSTHRPITFFDLSLASL